MTKRIAASAFALAVVALPAAIAQADTQRVGVTSAVNPAAAGTAPGATARQLVVGDDVIFRERVITTDEGQAQILFLDQSTLMIGPNSTVVIDEFVYDPSTSKGNIAATLTQGSFRYIGGKLSKQGNATLKTPIATIGIRGSDVTVAFDPSKNQTAVVTTHGIANVQTLGGVVGLRSGFGTTFGTDKPPSATSLTATQNAAATKIFEGQVGKSAGAGKPPTDADVANSGLSSAVQAQGLAATEPAAGGQSGSGAFTVPFRPGPNDAPPAPLQVAPTAGPTGPTGPAGPTGPTTAGALNGYVAGFGATEDEGTSGYRITNANNAPTDVEVRTTQGPTGVGRVLAKFNYRSSHGDVNASVEFGDPPGGTATKSFVTNESEFVATQSAAASAGKAQVNGVNASVTAALVGLPVTLCQCEFVKWGTWTAALQPGGSGAHEVVPVGLWVAGVLPDISDPSPTGLATFNGTAAGFVKGQPALVTGTFQNKYDFGARSGDVKIANFGGRTFDFKVNASNTDWRSYSGAPVSGSYYKGGINGSFYGSGGQETAGNFNVRKHGYSATGVFLGNR
jgi:hypothetical protein